MHDPMTVAFTVKWPIPQKTVLPGGGIFKSYEPIITVWHIDPELDGTDDSCGYTYPRLTDREIRIIDEIIEWEKSFPYYSSPYLPITQVDPNYDYSQQLAGDCLAHVAAAWSHIAWVRDGRRDLSSGEWWRVVRIATNPNDNLRSILSDKEEDAEDRVRRFFSCVIRQYLDYHRPWYRHPRWHIHHWKIQFDLVEVLWRRINKGVI